ncbi:methylene-tetrahydromethanopterin dehydrogenase [Methylohalomonas lacus]|uniref:Methylene-tetrahydromethanopterin dehydrogenase n=1 Tax=Methylohalomonas lacus TaxID=398773 RepID=A0AAE3L1R4_9GAMM|nr:NAD(P)-dependent methylenetetrahydromethanopterin dehydrogenase [Methylohalomonas lacus]MCS3904464.1 methylene-tetrahydromethanopterin dehydrogenase [Methylohalomonas lacus]
MKDPYLLHVFNPTKNVSPFDVNMAYEAEFDGVIPYSEVTLEEVHDLTQDTIFSRGPTGVKRTGIFIGGREFGLAMDMLNRARSAMVPPFEVSVFADPSGAITTAAALVAAVEVQFKRKTGEALKDKNIHIIGGTGPVGICAGILAANCGANVYLVSHRGAEAAQHIANEYNKRYDVDMRGADGASDEDHKKYLQECDVVIGSAKAGLQVLSKKLMGDAPRLQVAADVNAVPPLGLEGVGVHDMGKELDFTPNKALGIGALGVGNIKYKVHYRMFELMKQADKPLYLDHEKAFEAAREFAAEAKTK